MILVMTGVLLILCFPSVPFNVHRSDITCNDREFTEVTALRETTVSSQSYS